MKKILFLMLVAGFMSVSVTSWAGSGSTTGTGFKWTDKIGEPKTDPNAPSSFQKKMGDTQKTNKSSGGTHGQGSRY